MCEICSDMCDLLADVRNPLADVRNLLADVRNLLADVRNLLANVRKLLANVPANVRNMLAGVRNFLAEVLRPTFRVEVCVLRQQKFDKKRFSRTGKVRYNALLGGQKPENVFDKKRSIKFGWAVLEGGLRNFHAKPKIFDKNGCLR